MSFRFYPTLESRTDLKKRINVVPYDDYHLYKRNEYGIKELTVSEGRIKDTMWDSARDALEISRDFKINDPGYLYGPDGIACINAELGLCILWTNNATSMSGCILPETGSERNGESGWSVFFSHTFDAGEIKGILELRIVLYLKKCADLLYDGESILNNTEGVVVGELEKYRIEVSDEGMPFPFVALKSDTSALWWVEFSNWEDPAEDAVFGPSSFVVYLNENCKGCPKVTDKGVHNYEMMLEITASVYACLFKKLTYQQFQDMKQKRGLSGTISAELYRVYQLCREKFEYNEEYEVIHRSLQVAIKEAANGVSDIEEVSNA